MASVELCIEVAIGRDVARTSYLGGQRNSSMSADEDRDLREIQAKVDYIAMPFSSVGPAMLNSGLHSLSGQMQAVCAI